MTKKQLLFLFIFTCFFSFSQENRKYISGTILDSLGIVTNANIINLNTKQGTFSFENGAFRIPVSEGDSLRISTVQHIPKKIVISKNDIKNKKLIIYLKSNTYTLNEFELKRNNLTGRLGIDMKYVPTDKRDSLLGRLMDFSKIDFKAKDPTIDGNIKAKPPIVNTTPNSFSGAGGSVSIPFKDSERLWALRRKIAHQEAFPKKILSELGEKFFFDELKIPPEKYYHFLEYCNPLDIENLHKKGKLLEVIKILRTESKGYLKIIKKE